MARWWSPCRQHVLGDVAIPWWRDHVARPLWQIFRPYKGKLCIMFSLPLHKIKSVKKSIKSKTHYAKVWTMQQFQPCRSLNHATENYSEINFAWCFLRLCNIKGVLKNRLYQKRMYAKFWTVLLESLELFDLSFCLLQKFVS